MGTNYYLETKPPCECCGRPWPDLHIGKSSGGWCFSLHVDDERKSLADWVSAWCQEGAVIRDEYGRTLTSEQMLDVITKRKGRDPKDFDHSRNYSQPGPNGLVRHTIGPHCVGHGEGTWDLIPGEFS